MKLSILTSLFLSALLPLSATSCDDDNKNSYETHTVYVEAATYIGYIPTFGDTNNLQEGMMVTFEDNLTPKFFPLEHIEGFTYKRGHAYELKIRRTILANPPADALNYTDTLLEVLSDTPAPAQREEVILEVSDKTSPIDLDKHSTRSNIVNLGINIREKGSTEWQTVAFNKIGGFQYQPKHKAELRVDKITLEAIGHDTKFERFQQVMYELKEIISETEVQ